jgi:hypothetical protein
MANQGKKYFLYVLYISFFIIAIAGNLKAQWSEDVSNKQLKLLGGLCLPTGDFGSTGMQKGGYAKTGFSAGVEYNTKIKKDLEVGVMGNLSMNGIDEAAMEKTFTEAIYYLTGHHGPWNLTTSSWHSIDIMGSVGFRTDISPAVDIYGRGYMGLSIGFMPEIKLTSAIVNVVQTSATAAAFGYGLGAGIIIDRRFDIGIRYISAEPEFETTASGGGFSFTDKSTQPMGRVQLQVGYVFNL